MLEKVPVEHVKRTFEFVPGGDLRSSQNNWLRSAWERSELKKVPREKQFRLILLKICKKNRSVSWHQSFDDCFGFSIFVFLYCIHYYPSHIIPKSSLTSEALQLPRISKNNGYVNKFLCIASNWFNWFFGFAYDMSLTLLAPHPGLSMP